MNNSDLIYQAFFRENPPSILRLACLQLIREGVDFTNEDTWEETWNLIWDRAELIVNEVHRNKKAKCLHRNLINIRIDS